jgi:hypothetical protein
MAYFKIGATDFSKYVSSLKVKTANNYTALNNAAGNTVVDFINAKRTIEVGIIPLKATAVKELLTAISAFNVSISFLNPNTDVLENNVNCIIPDNEIDYYTIQANNVKCKAFNLVFIEL